jgi:hypothetical protein
MTEYQLRQVRSVANHLFSAFLTPDKTRWNVDRCKRLGNLACETNIVSKDVSTRTGGTVALHQYSDAQKRILQVADIHGISGFGAVTAMALASAVLEHSQEARDRYRAGPEALAMMAACDDPLGKILHVLVSTAMLYLDEVPTLRGTW